MRTLVLAGSDSLDLICFSPLNYSFLRPTDKHSLASHFEVQPVSGLPGQLLPLHQLGVPLCPFISKNVQLVFNGLLVQRDLNELEIDGNQ